MCWGRKNSRIVLMKWMKRQKEKLGSFLTFWISFYVYNKNENFFKSWNLAPNLLYLSFFCLKSTMVYSHWHGNGSFRFKPYSSFSFDRIFQNYFVYYYLLNVLLEKTMMLGKDWGQEVKGLELRWLIYHRLRWLQRRNFQSEYGSLSAGSP